MRLRISLCNEAGELSGKTVRSEEAAKDAAIELIESVPFLNAGDVIRVAELIDEPAED